jgi:hypothetical protein
MECLAIGDSIAVGVGEATGCKVAAQVGRTTAQQAALIRPLNAEWVVISLGSNDPRSPNLMQNLQFVRANILAKKVVWLLPYDLGAAEIVRKVAAQRRDGVIVLLNNFSTKDGIHPADYRAVSSFIMQNWRS